MYSSPAMVYSGVCSAILLAVTTNAGTPYEQWAASFGLTGTQAQFQFDADYDGLDNLSEYALNTSPVAKSTAPVIGLNAGGLLSFSFTRPNNRSDLSTVGQYSTNLADWSGSPALVQTSIANNGNGTETITVSASAAAPSSASAYLRLSAEEVEWLPPGNWTLDWADEFSGTGAITKWYPLLGYNHVDFQANNRKGIRWSGATETTSRMYSTRTGNHWLNGNGQMEMRIVTDKTEQNLNGNVVNSAYLLSGYPQSWDPDPLYSSKWAGKFVSPANGPIYISARVRTDQVVGYSTWFAFWLFSETRAYDGNPVNGTEVDVIEIPKGLNMTKIFAVANHWRQTGGSESKQFNSLSTPTALSFVDVSDSYYHVYGIEWSTTAMKCYVDSKLYYTFTSNIPTNPVDMMMLLTLEFQINAWQTNQGDGRSAGPFVSDSATMREMSRALIDYVRIYKKQ